MRVIGLMSGTSYDGIDAAAAELTFEDADSATGTDAEIGPGGDPGATLLLDPLGWFGGEHPEEVRAALAAQLPPSGTTMEAVCRLDTALGQAFAGAADRARRELCAGRADLVVSHGQTVYHWTEAGRVRGTLQLGQPAWIAERTGLPVVSDLRARDVAAGGQGAPLVSAFDVLWLRGRPGRPVALNLGGIANLTAAADGEEPVAFDTGPANALLDAAVRYLTEGRQHYDADGRLGARGTVHPPLLAHLLREPYYARTPPKTTGKELFHLPYLRERLRLVDPLPPEDVVATVTALTARTVAEAVRAVGGTEVIASGGGTRNPTLLAMLRRELGALPLRTSDELGLPSAAKEAYAFAVLGFLSLHGLPATVPACTGAAHPSVLGSLTPGADGFPPLPPRRRAPTRLRIEAAAR
ncbi:anhydro-N-acetylmuramic acid kinase [Streptomyces physcomitrii]